MVQRLPGFRPDFGDQGVRGFAEAGGNVLINGAPSQHEVWGIRTPRLRGCLSVAISEPGALAPRAGLTPIRAPKMVQLMIAGILSV